MSVISTACVIVAGGVTDLVVVVTICWISSCTTSVDIWPWTTDGSCDTGWTCSWNWFNWFDSFISPRSTLGLEMCISGGAGRGSLMVSDRGSWKGVLSGVSAPAGKE